MNTWFVLYIVFAAVILAIQELVMVEAWRHMIFTIRKCKPKPPVFTPRIALIAPCKGIDHTFEKNIQSFFELDYPDYEIFFVVENQEDPAYIPLRQIIQSRSQNPPSPRARLLVAGLAQDRSQKIHNQLCALDSLPDDIQAIAFVDSDVCLRKHFLASLIHPLRRSEFGASTGYRWFVPTDRRLSTAALSAINAFIASLMGPHPWNSAWGGAMAITRPTLEKIRLRKFWDRACTDDYALTHAVKQAGLLVAFVPACFVPSYESTTWKYFFSFARRQFIITRVYQPKLWTLALLGLGYYLFAFWLGVFVTLCLWRNQSPYTLYAAILPGVLYLNSMLKAFARQMLIRKILPEDRNALFLPAVFDLFFQPLLHLFTFATVLAAGFTRTILWRGIQYRLHNAEYTEIIRPAEHSVIK